MTPVTYASGGGVSDWQRQTDPVEEDAMKALALFVVTVTVSICIMAFVCRPVRAAEPAPAAMTMDMGEAGAQPSRAAAASGAGQASFEALKKLFGRWEALLGDNKTIVDTFQPFAFGAAILAEE